MQFPRVVYFINSVLVELLLQCLQQFLEKNNNIQTLWKTPSLFSHGAIATYIIVQNTKPPPQKKPLMSG